MSELSKEVKKDLRKSFQTLSRSLNGRGTAFKHEDLKELLNHVFNFDSPTQSENILEAIDNLINLKLIPTFVYNQTSQQIAFCPVIFGVNRSTSKNSFVFPNGMTYENVNQFFDNCYTTDVSWLVFYKDVNDFAAYGEDATIRKISTSKRSRQRLDLFSNRTFAAGEQIIRDLKQLTTDFKTKDFDVLKITDDGLTIRVSIKTDQDTQEYDVSMGAVYDYILRNAKSTKYSKALSFKSDRCEDIIRRHEGAQLLKNFSVHNAAEIEFNKIYRMIGLQSVYTKVIYNIVLTATLRMDYTLHHVYESMFVHVLSQFIALVKQELTQEFKIVKFPDDEIEQRLEELIFDLNEKSESCVQAFIEKINGRPLEEFGDRVVRCTFTNDQWQKYTLVNLINPKPPTQTLVNKLFDFVKTVVVKNEKLSEPIYTKWFYGPSTVGYRRRCYFNTDLNYAFFVKTKLVNGKCSRIMVEEIQKSSMILETETDVRDRLIWDPDATAVRLTNEIKRKCSAIGAVWQHCVELTNKKVKLADWVNPYDEAKTVREKVLKLLTEEKVFFSTKHDAVSHTFKRGVGRKGTIFEMTDISDVKVAASEFFKECFRILCSRWTLKEACISSHYSTHDESLNMILVLHHSKAVINCGGYVPTLKTCFRSAEKIFGSHEEHRGANLSLLEGKEKNLCAMLIKWFFYGYHLPKYVFDLSRHDIVCNLKNNGFIQDLLCVITKHTGSESLPVFLSKLHAAMQFIGNSWDVIEFANQTDYESSNFHKDRTHFVYYKTKQLLIHSSNHVMINETALISVFKKMIELFRLPLYTQGGNYWDLFDYINRERTSRRVQITQEKIDEFCEFSEAKGFYWHVFKNPKRFQLCKHKLYLSNSSFLIASVFRLLPRPSP